MLHDTSSGLVSNTHRFFHLKTDEIKRGKIYGIYCTVICSMNLVWLAEKAKLGKTF
jgi:hypothetical protein